VDQKNDRTPSEQSQPAEQPPAPRKRFRIEKLEERIAPSKGNGKGNTGVSHGGGGGIGSVSGSGSIVNPSTSY
jgi:hypothetical protein